MNPETWPLFLLTPKVFREVLEGELVQDCGPPGSPRHLGSTSRPLMPVLLAQVMPEAAPGSHLGATPRGLLATLEAGWVLEKNSGLPARELGFRS